MKIADVLSFLENAYPSYTQADWDNSGLQVGRTDESVTGIYLTLTLTPEHVEQAMNSQCNLVLTHHPVIFQPLRSVNLLSPQGRLISSLLRAGITAYSMHTNLDVAEGGVSSVLAAMYKLKNCRVLQRTGSEEMIKLVLYVPDDHLELLRDRMSELGFGHIGNYSGCTFASPGVGSFIPAEGTTPYLGTKSTFNLVDEARLETIIPLRRLGECLPPLLETHPYEEPAYDLIPLRNEYGTLGFGRIGDVESCFLEQFIMPVPGSWKGSHDPQRLIRRVAVCGGSGGKLVEAAFNMGADLLITGEVGYHEDLLARDLGLAVLDIGHEASESPVIPFLAQRLSAQFPQPGFDIIFR